MIVSLVHVYILLLWDSQWHWNWCPGSNPECRTSLSRNASRRVTYRLSLHQSSCSNITCTCLQTFLPDESLYSATTTLNELRIIKRPVPRNLLSLGSSSTLMFVHMASRTPGTNTSGYTGEINLEVAGASHANMALTSNITASTYLHTFNLDNVITPKPSQGLQTRPPWSGDLVSWVGGGGGAA